jgi:hypothetical protein
LNAAPAEIIGWWFVHVSGLVGDDGLARAGHTLRDLVLALADYPADPDGGSFPLFTLLEGIARDRLSDSALKNVQTTLDALALSRGVTRPGIMQLRRHVDAVQAQRGGKDKENSGAIALDRSVLVVIEPDMAIRSPQHYFLRVYDWLPWESTETERSMRSRGRAVDGSEVGPSRTAADLLSAEGKMEIGKEIGRRLRAIPAGAVPAASPFVEFLVPGALICADFDLIKIDAFGDVDLFDDEKPIEIPLGMWARVVVRSLERWRLVEARRRREPGLTEEDEPRLEKWKQRWCSVMNASARPSTTCWWWKSGLDHVRASVLLEEQRNVGCVGWAGISPDRPRNGVAGL